MKLGDMPIHPGPAIVEERGATVLERSRHAVPVHGMTLRQYYAGLAMQGYIIKGLEGSTAYAIVAADAVRSADALLNELEK